VSEKFQISDLLSVTFQSLIIDDKLECHDFILSNGKLSVSCLWRLIVDEKILGTSKDIGLDHWMNNFKEPNEILDKYVFGQKITDAYALDGIGDLKIYFENGTKLEVIKDHGSLEVWEVSNDQGLYLLPDAWGTINGWTSADKK